MSKTISVALKAHYALPLATLARLWQVVRTDGTILGFTDAGQDVTYLDNVAGFSNTVTYKASTGFTASSIRQMADMSIDNLTVDGVLSSASITDADLAEGRYDFAKVLILEVNYKDLTMGHLILKSGVMGEVTRKLYAYQAELRGKAQFLQTVIGDIYSPTCTATLGDTRCKQNLASFTFAGSVTVATSNRVFTDGATAQADGFYNNGKITWLTGANAGLSMEIKSFATKVFSLVQSMPRTIAIGDTYSAVAGCDKVLSTCVSKFNNVVNFRGFPFIPGIDKLLNYPNAK